MGTVKMETAEFWEDIAARLGAIHHEIHLRHINLKDGEHLAVMQSVMAGAVRAKQVRDAAIIEQWERRPRLAGRGRSEAE